MAAGLGFKTFTTGEVLTAADVNGYLMQGVLVFANAAARDAAITSPQEGQCCYLKDTDAVLTYSGTAWVGFDDSNAIQNAIVDAKGDLIAATAADTPARLAVGSANQVLTVDSSTATGLKWSSLGSFTSFTPTWNNITVGNGTNTGAYTTIGDIVYGYATLTFGSTTSITGNVNLSFPVSFSAPDEHNISTVRFVDAGTAVYEGFGVAVTSTSSIYLLVATASGTYVGNTNMNSTTPFTWVNGDSVRVVFQYRKA